MCFLQNVYYSQKKTKCNNNKENIFFILGDPTKFWPCSYVFPSRMKNQGYVVLLEILYIFLILQILNFLCFLEIWYFCILIIFLFYFSFDIWKLGIQFWKWQEYIRCEWPCSVPLPHIEYHLTCTVFWIFNQNLFIVWK